METIRATIQIDINDTFDADINLGLNQIIQFFENCSNEDKMCLRAALRLREYSTMGKTIYDNLKLELLKEANEKYTLEELETRLK